MYLNQILGKHGEDIACNYLINENYEIIERNYRCKQGEIDIIANDLSKKELVFIEVKTRSNFNFGRPVQSINIAKQNHILKVSNYYLYKHNLQNSFIRFDAIEVFIEKYTFKINHIKQIF